MRRRPLCALRATPTCVEIGTGRDGGWPARSPSPCLRELAEGEACFAGVCGMADFDRSCVAGFCRRRLELGEACVEVNNADRCRGGLSCVGGRCSPW